MTAQAEQGILKPMDFFYRVVMHERDAHRTGIRVQPQPSHEAWGIHVSIANADPRIRQCLRNNCRLTIGEIETKSGDAFVESRFIVDAVNGRPNLVEDLKQLV
jgi:hypothetical protein